MNNKMLPASGSNDVHFPYGPSRKRKSEEIDLSGTLSWNSNLQQNSSLSGINGLANTREISGNLMKFLKPVTSSHQFGNAQFPYLNNFSENGLNNNEHSFRPGIENLSYDSLRVPAQSLQFGGAFPSANVRVGNTYEMLTFPSQTCNIDGRREASRPVSSQELGDKQREKYFDPGLQDLGSFGRKNHVIMDKMPVGMCNASSSSEYVRPVQIMHQGFLWTNSLSGKSEISLEFKQGVACQKNGGNCNLQSTQTDNPERLQDEGKFGKTRPANCSSHTSESREQSRGGAQLSGTSECREHNGGGGEIKRKEDIESHRENLTSLSGFIPSKNGAGPANNGQKNGPSDNSLKLDEKSGLLSPKAAPTVAEKLWDGSLKLNSSVTVSAVAFFKSGEKLVDVKWSEFVEVKGKVRLDAFEKYIQDLPRSRNRGLMVISLRWKEGSSGTELKGMREVAKGYRKCERVGFAQLSPGIDVYICPWSETIITILAKYGFFKGMTAVEDNQDSMIGCVVWRKTQPIDKKNDENKKNESSEKQHQNSPSESSTEQVISKNVESNGGQQSEVANSSTSSVDTKPCLEINKAPFADVVKQTEPSDDDDDNDLPEFDFGAGCGISRNQKGVPASTIPVSKQRSEHSKIGICSVKNESVLENRAISTPPPPFDAAAVKNFLPNLSKKKNLFYEDDDDDMPEWCPPKPILHHLTPPPLPRLPPPPPPPAAGLLPVFNRPMSNNLRGQNPIFSQIDPRSVMGFGSNPVLRPHTGSFDRTRAGWRP